MFVLRGKYNALVTEHALLQLRHATQLAKYKTLLSRWNDLVRLINQLGGMEYLERGKTVVTNQTFSQKEIETLIRLCHPDKHNNSTSATDITQRLLSIRNKK